MNEKTGRNDSCHCGSGKKYKKCCFGLVSSSKTADIIDLEWHKLRQLEGTVFDRHLFPYVTKELPDDVIKSGIDECLPDDLPDGVDKELLFNNFFIPWLLFNWIPNEDFEIDNFDPEVTLAQNYISFHESSLSSRERIFIDVMNQTYYSFYSVLEVVMNQSLLVKDILLGTRHTIKERQGTHSLKRGDIVFSRILTINNQSIFVGMAPFCLPANHQNSLLDFKDWLIEENDDEALTPEALRNDFDLDLLDYFFDALEEAYNRPFPTLLNTDGELMQFSKSHFKLTMSPEEALNCLLPLTLSNDPEEFLQDAKRDKSGKMKLLEFPWLKKGNKQHKSWNNTVMGHISIEKDKLVLETNSEKRTQKGKKLLTKYLGKSISFQLTLIESPKQKLQSSPPSSQNKQAESEQLMALPEIQEQLKAMATVHWKNWFNEPIPALDHQTPRQAAKTEKGRERLEALLLQYERHDAERGEHPFKADVAYLKSVLELD